MRQGFKTIRRLFGEQPQKKHTGPRTPSEARLATWWWSALPAPSSIVLNPDWFPAPSKQKSSGRKRKWWTKGKRKVRARGEPPGGCSDRRRTERLSLSETYRRRKALAAAPVFKPRGLVRGSPARGSSTLTQGPSRPPRPPAVQEFAPIAFKRDVATICIPEAAAEKRKRDPVVDHLHPSRNTCCTICNDELFYGWHVNKAEPRLTFPCGDPLLWEDIDRIWWLTWNDPLNVYVN